MEEEIQLEEETKAEPMVLAEMVQDRAGLLGRGPKEEENLRLTMMSMTMAKEEMIMTMTVAHRTMIIIKDKRSGHKKRKIYETNL